ncbi:MAG: hypothetical protein M3Q79_04775 [bacterium]|nr:hypothetical protein [bacterium]
MAKPINLEANWYHSSLLGAVKIHFYFIVVYAAYTGLSKAWNVITNEASLWRWVALGILSVIVITVWWLSRQTNKAHGYYKLLLQTLIVSDVLFASFNVFSQRGMASRAVALYALPIIVAACLLKVRWLVATTLLCAVSYIFSAWWYFHTHFNEGYKAELVFEVGFYSLFFMVLGASLLVLIRPKTR